MKLLRGLLLASSLFGLNACLLEADEDAEGGVIQYLQCSAPDANNKLYDYLDDWYLWYGDLPTERQPEAHEDAIAALNDIREQVDRDRFSFAMTAQQYEDYRASIFFGYGFSHTNNEANDGLLIRYVFSEGSAAQQGLRRGDTLLEVNGESMASILAQVDAGATTLSEVFGPNEQGYSISVKFEKPSGEIIDTEFTKGSISANTVMATQVKAINVAGEDKKVGYLVFDSFDSKSEQELNTAFDTFALERIDELVLDLRYNSGGLIRVAQQLSTQIAGDAVSAQVFTKYIHNDKQSDSNREVKFSLGQGVEQMNLDRVVVLTTGASCSASELVINALSPFVEVVTIGQPTCGKPVGMYPEEICDYVVFAINFETQNAANQGGYFDGLPVTCPVIDQVTGDWGIDSDPLLTEGLYYLTNDACRSGGEAKARSGSTAVKQLKQNQELDFSKGPWHARRLL